MFRNILTKTLYDNRKPIAFWSVGVFLLVLMYASIYPSLAGSDQLMKALQNLPDAFKSIIGNLDEYATPAGFIGAEWFSLTYPLLLGILGIVMGSGLLTKEEDSGTMELLLARPVSRATVVRQKTAAMVGVLAAIGLGSWAAIAVGTLVVNKFDINLLHALEACTIGVLLGWSFALLALAVTGIRSNRGLAAGLASLVFAVSYVVSTVAAKVDWLAPLRRVSLFELYKPTNALREGWELKQVLVFLAVCVVCYAVAEIGFQRRDTGR